jgi:beta-lactam-binding protein with PASTA domain
MALSLEAQALLGVAAKGRPVKALGERESSGRMPNFRGLKLDEVLNRSSEAHCDPVLTGSGRVVAQTPRAGEVLEPGARCELTLDERTKEVRR